ncbi:hypothetical protein H072_9415 [Dactylellina haptotyla CBS 200.50]|uniref:Uncharacterized protein n=1 Tax=Dactylellina haptotyla (strain CBS 200.50) TaxID=1284197 RepID=S8A201_DACHA|nr:hypothetical protein H072_9415 [Dactylellina haptotyla CBS 200.50]
MALLRLEAAKAVKQRLGLKNVAAKNVKFNTRPFPKLKTIYIWKIAENANGGLTPEERGAVERTIYCDRDNRKFATWEDADRCILTHLIEKGALVPDYYNKSSDGVNGAPDSWEPPASDTEMESDIDSVSDDGEKDGDTAINRAFIPTRKRQRSLSIEITSETDVPPLSAPDVASTPQVADLPAPSEKLSLIQMSTNSDQPGDALRETLATGSAVTAPAESSSGTQTPLMGSEAPRTMSLNAQGILEFIPSQINIPPPLPYSATLAPVAASPVTTDSNNSDQSSTVGDDLDGGGDPHEEHCRKGIQDLYEEHCRKSIQDLTRCMQGFLNGATVGYLEGPKLQKDNCRLKKENRRLKEMVSKMEKEQGTKMSVLKGQIESLQASFEVQLRNKGLLETKVTLSEDQSKLLEVQLGEARSANRQLEDSLRASKESESTMKKEHDALRENFQREKSDLVKGREDLESDLRVYQAEAGYLKEQLLGVKQKLEEAAESRTANEQCLQESIKKLQEERDAAIRDRQDMVGRVLVSIGI